MHTLFKGEKQSHNEDLKEMNDVSSGMASRVIQLYLQEILDCFMNRDDTVRLWAVKVIQIVLRQGLVHPVRMVPYLICLSTDCKLEVKHIMSFAKPEFTTIVYLVSP